MNTFYEFLKSRIAAGGFSTEDTLASLLPLMRQACNAHGEGQVAPLAGIEALQVAGTKTWYAESGRLPVQNRLPEVQKILAAQRGPVDIISRQEQSIGSGEQVPDKNLDVMPRTQQPHQPGFVPGFLCWEHLLDHHDPLTDIFSLGQLLASLSLGLDFNEAADVRRFATHRRNLFAINDSVHPVVARAIVQMTELDRRDRTPELAPLIATLENYRLQEIEISVDPDEIEGFHSRDLQGKQQVLLDRLQTRLFEITRRNRLLNFRATLQSVNLTQASVPLSFDYKNIRADQILTCDQNLTGQITSGQPIPLNKYLNFAEVLYLPGVLNQILRQSRRDSAEFGFVQLRLVLCTLNWANLKSRPAERFSSPLVMVPVYLRKQRGVRDTWSLLPVTQEAEINPVVRYLFRQWYDIDLPEQLDLNATDLDSLYQFMCQAIAASEPAVELKRIDRPRIRILHAQARRRLERYQRRSRISGRGIRTLRDIDYSYDPANYHPLGIRLFSNLIRRPETRLSAIMHSQPRPRYYAIPGAEPDGRDPALQNDDAADADQHPESPVDGARDRTNESAGNGTAEQRFFEMAEGADDNPWNWSFDLCNVTLANFRTRKMSLVRDYEQLVTDTPRNAAFESVFSLTPRPEVRQPPVPPLDDRFEVVPCDPTQAMSIAQSRQRDSYIIQGPPGTGKSQTITNLIADFAARGQRVLFVCEKRAAIDVVFARLRQCGLDDLCCLIHDSQADKKSFVMDLRDTYESFLQRDVNGDSVESRRTSLVSGIAAGSGPLQAYADAMLDESWQAGVSTSELLEHAVRLRQHIPDLTELQQEQLPAWRSWNEHRPAIQAVLESLPEQQPDGVLARHPLRNLAAPLAYDPTPVQTVTEGIEESQGLLDQLNDALSNVPDVDLMALNLSQIRKLIQYCQTIQPLLDSTALALVIPDSQSARQLEQSQIELHNQQSQVTRQLELNSAWRQRIPPRDLPTALDSARRLADSWVPIIYPAWWRLRRVMKQGYDFSAHTVRPDWVRVLEQLQNEYAAEESVASCKRKIAEQFQWKISYDEMLARIQALHDELADCPDWLRSIHQRMAELSADSAMATQLQRAAGAIIDARSTTRQLRRRLDEFLTGFELLTIQEVAAELRSIKQSIGLLPDYLGCLKQLAGVPEDVRVALQRMDLTPTQIEAAAAARTLELIARERPEFGGFNQDTRRDCLESLARNHEGWMAINAELVRDRVKKRFQDHVHLSNTPAAGSLTETQDAFRKTWIAGRKELEHEFGKQMRYKSIRDLVSGDSGQVIRDLKPIWLMSPLSVSDTLPLGDHEFDVVIFDEASQITLESAVPSLFRAGQAIVVGDEQQLPPTSFFETRNEDEEQEVQFEEEGQMFAYQLQRGSLLNHSSRNLPSTMLGWHYRSRDESLISFSNAAFYGGRLLTIPEETILRPTAGTLTADSSESAVEHLAALADRPISFHRMEHGIYHRRRNRPEAEYIAELVRQLLGSDDGKTIGIIAFSEAQQEEIESAIDRLAADDPSFSRRLESELVREDDGQFTGLLIKNLENIQGDERDIVILSICYGPDAEGQMRMNFGPINQSGGEKRLNVAFSRAKHHMAIVSTIGHAAITNRHNIGANCLCNYLRYAEAISRGDAGDAELVLHSLSPPGEPGRSASAVSPILQDIADRLSEHGLLADFHVGHSEFRCDIGLRREGDVQYRLGLLVDGGDWYRRNPNTIDRELNRPRLLEIFGWRIRHVLARDWYQAPQEIVAEILESCQPDSNA